MRVKLKHNGSWPMATMSVSRTGIGPIINLLIAMDEFIPKDDDRPHIIAARTLQLNLANAINTYMDENEITFSESGQLVKA